ncbi:MAG: hypothetical protein WBG46_12535 [Nonlabens sp.]
MKLRDIKDNFNEREIQPGAGSWEKLSAQLDVAEKNKKRPYLYWLGAVAAILVVALLAYPVMSGVNSRNEDPNNQVVVQEPPADNENIKEVNKSPQSEVAVEIKLGSELNEQEKSIEKEKEKAPVAKNLPAATHVKQALAQTHSSNKINKDHKTQPQKVEDKIISQTQEAVANVESIDSSTMVEDQTKPALTADQEAAKLLEKLLGNDNTEVVSTRSIKSEQLLRETEWDIEADRHNRINKGLKDGLGKLKNEAFALIGRNN